MITVEMSSETCNHCLWELEQQGQQGALPQVGLATADRVLGGKEQRQVRDKGGPQEGADITNYTHQIGPCETIFHSSSKTSAAFKYLQDLLLKLSEAQDHR